MSRAVLLNTVSEGNWRRVWQLGGTVTAVERSDWVILRSKEEWGPREELERAIAWWQAKSYKAASPSGLLLQAARSWYRPLAWSRHGFAAPYVRGGWEHSDVRGTITGPHCVYDIRRAYRAALTLAPFPRRETIRIARRFTPDRPGLHLCVTGAQARAPWPLNRGGTVLLETPIDCERYNPTILEWRGGVTWNGTIDAGPLADVIDAIGCAALQRVYWGLWCAGTSVRCTFKGSGKVTTLKPFGTDYVRAHLITARVRRQQVQDAPNAIYRYVDAVITTPEHAPPVGDKVGDWREVKRYEQGVTIYWPGAYGPAGGKPDKMSGVPVAERSAVA